MSATALPLRFQVGARTLLAVRRRLVRVPLTLEQVLAERAPALPPLPAGAHGYQVTSLPENRLAALRQAGGALRPFVRQRYNRYFTDLSGGFDAFLAGLSANTRAQLKRKGKRIAATSGGTLDVRRFVTPDELAAFHPIARAIAERTYQERLMGAGLPASPEFLADMHARAAAGTVRAWLLYVGGTPAAYLYCPIVGTTVLYSYVGHDPAFGELSPGSVLQLEALRDLFAVPGLTHYDFTEGEGQHKRQLATGAVPCVDLLLLTPGAGNRALVAALDGFDRTTAEAKRLVERLDLQRWAKALRR